jgi:hypothetical protein
VRRPNQKYAGTQADHENEHHEGISAEGNVRCVCFSIERIRKNYPGGGAMNSTYAETHSVGHPPRLNHASR